MKIIDIQLGRRTSYGGSQARAAQPWQATYFDADTKSAYPDEREIPAWIAEKMALAAFNTLVESGFFAPAFDGGVTALPVVEPEPETPNSSADRTPQDDLAPL